MFGLVPVIDDMKKW